MKKTIIVLAFIILFLTEISALALEPPVLTSNVSGVRLSLSWTAVPGATGYMLVYAPYPFQGMETVQAINMGDQTGLSVDLWDKAALYLTVVATDGYTLSGYSNIELIKIEASPAPEPPTPSQGGVQNLILNYRVLVEYFEYLSPEQIAGIFKGLDSARLLDLGIYDPFGSLVHYYACQYDPSLMFSGGTSSYVSCSQQEAYWANTAQFSSNPTEYALSQRDSLLISIKCATGEIDSASCSAYVGGMSAYGSMSHDTSMTIIDNIGGNCYLGEPGCVP